MLKVHVGSSSLSDSKAAGKEAALAAGKNLDLVSMAFVYGSCDYDSEALLAGVAEGLPGVPCLGNSSFTGIIVPSGFVGQEGPFAGVMALSDSNLHVGIASIEKGIDTVANGEALARAAMEAAGQTTAPDFFYMAASPAEEELYLEGICNVIGRVPFFGGSAADNSISGNWKLYCNDKAFSDGAAVAFFYGDLKMTNLFTGAYDETEHSGVITKVRGRRTLVEIDGIPATEKYAAWLDCDMESVSGEKLLGTAITAPLGVKDRLGKLVAIRHPLHGNDDGSMEVGNDLAEKTCVICMKGSVDNLIDSVGLALKDLLAKTPGKPSALHLVHCGGRRAAIADRIDEVTARLQSLVGDIPFIVEFTFGEYGFERDDVDACGGLMLSFTALSN